MPSPKPIAKRRQRRYVVRQIRIFLRMYALLGPCSSLRLFAKSYHIPEATFRRWVANSSSYLAKKTHGPRATLHGKGRLESVEFSSDLVAFMESVRDGEHFLTTAHLVTWMKSHRPLWLKAYMDAKLNDDRASKSLLQWCLKYANRHGYFHRVPCAAKATQSELQVVQEAFSAEFFSKFGHLPRRAWINVDETPVYYDMPPGKTLAKVGKSSRVKETQKHSDRITVVL
ncbi:hypothetical protein DYB25_012829 [Aphanomyces astaci]|uniref:DDE-1 domain-containing protein n=1 Tax=Aphanomyces astaci TaxID=112090 RepID=A0A397A5J5_APHAT|nr:hypothetical protein DYB25_012829 [Aphanomyces astaci]